MPFDPSLPANNAPIVSAELRGQFNALNALVPIGAVLAWFKDLPGVPVLPENFVECNGQFLEDDQSPLHNQNIPDLNTGAGGRFLRGGTNSGATGGIDYFATAPADNSGSGAPFSAVTIDFSPGAVPFPPYATAVFVMRVK